MPESVTLGAVPPSIAARGEALLQSLQAASPGKAARELKIGIVDLRQLVSVQRAIALDDIGSRVAQASPDHWESLADLCWASPDADAEDLKGAFDKDGKGVTISSANPNLRVAPVQNLVTPGPAGGRFLGFQVVFGTRHLHVAEYRERLFLKDGYHRAYGLLARGITHVPCVYEKVEHFQAVHGGGVTLIAPEHILGDRPPRVIDFLDDQVSTTVEQQFFRKVIRIRAEEFVVNV